MFSQHRSKEPTLIWLEGADTLTTDAQAILRRILETAAPNVEFALEVRDESTMNPPLLSRCQRITMPNISFRKQSAIAMLEKRGYTEIRKVRQAAQQRSATWTPLPTLERTREALLQARNLALPPEQLLHPMLEQAPFELRVQSYRR